MTNATAGGGALFSSLLTLTGGALYLTRNMNLTRPSFLWVRPNTSTLTNVSYCITGKLIVAHFRSSTGQKTLSQNVQPPPSSG